MSAPEHPAGRQGVEPAKVDHFSHGYYATCEESEWCPVCMLPSAATVERRVALIDEDGATSMRIAAYLYCFDHEDFVARVPVQPETGR